MKEDLLSLFPDLVPNPSLLQFDSIFHGKGFKLIAGIDEVGRGPLAGPVVAAAVIFSPGIEIEKIDDSKKLTPKRREELYQQIKESALDISLGVIHSDEIDRLNILKASLKAMKLAVQDLTILPDLLLIDGTYPIHSKIHQITLRKGDSRSQSIAAASIVAKVRRDRIMLNYHDIYPRYAFHKHKGYGTKVHLKAIRRYGCCPLHRRTFKGVRDFLSYKGPQGEFKIS